MTNKLLNQSVVGSQKSRKVNNKVSPKRLMLSPKEKWRAILSEIDTSAAPVTTLNNVVVSLNDGSNVNIDIDGLIKKGVPEKEIMNVLGNKLSEWEHIIDNVDCYIKVDSVAKQIQPITDELLKQLR